MCVTNIFQNMAMHAYMWSAISDIVAKTIIDLSLVKGNMLRRAQCEDYEGSGFEWGNI